MAGRRRRGAALGDLSTTTKSMLFADDMFDGLLSPSRDGPEEDDDDKKGGEEEEDEEDEQRRGQTPLEDRWQAEGFMALSIPQLQEQGFSYSDAKAMLERSKKSLAGKGGLVADLLAKIDGNAKPGAAAAAADDEDEEEGGGTKRRSNRKTETEIKLEKFHGVSRHEALFDIEFEIKRVSKESGPPDKVGEWALRNLAGQVGQQTRDRPGFTKGADLFDQYKVVLEVGDELKERKKATRGKYEKVRVSLNANAVFTKAANEMRSVSAADAEIFERHNLKEVVKDVWARYFENAMQRIGPDGLPIEDAESPEAEDVRDALLQDGIPLDGVELIVNALHDYHERCGHEWHGDKKKGKAKNEDEAPAGVAEGGGGGGRGGEQGDARRGTRGQPASMVAGRRRPPPQEKKITLPSIRERYGRDNITEKWSKGPARLAPAFEDEFDTSALKSDVSIRWVEVGRGGGRTRDGGGRDGRRTGTASSSRHGISRGRSPGKMVRSRLQRKNLPTGRARQIRKHTEQLMRSMSSPCPYNTNLTTERRQAAAAKTANDGMCTSSMVAVADAAPEQAEDYEEGDEESVFGGSGGDDGNDSVVSGARGRASLRVTESRNDIHRRVARERRDHSALSGSHHVGRDTAFLRMQEVWRCLSVPSWLRLETRIQISGSAAAREWRESGKDFEAHGSRNLSRQNSQNGSGSGQVTQRTGYSNAEAKEEHAAINKVVDFWETIADMMHNFTLLRATAIDYLLGGHDPEEKVNPNFVPEKIIISMVKVEAYLTPDPLEPMLLYLATLLRNFEDKALDLLDDLDSRIREGCSDATATNNDLDSFLGKLRDNLNDMGLISRLKKAHQKGLQLAEERRRAADATAAENGGSAMPRRGGALS